MPHGSLRQGLNDLGKGNRMMNLPGIGSNTSHQRKKFPESYLKESPETHVTPPSYSVTVAIGRI